MAVAHDNFTESHTGTTGHTGASSFNFSHDPTGVPKAVIVFAFTIAGASSVSSVSYAGTDVPALASGEASHTGGEPGNCKVFFLGSGVPTTDPATVVINRSENTAVVYAVCVTVTAGGDCAAVGIVPLTGNGAYAVQSVNDGTPSTGNSVRYAGCYYGGATPAPAGTGSTELCNIDFSAFGITVVRETTAGNGARNVGVTQVTSDDRAAIHFAVIQLATPTTDSGTAVLTLTPSGSEALVVPKNTGTAQISLGSIATPDTRTQHKIIVRARKTNGAHSGYLRCQLYESTTARSAVLQTTQLTTSFVDYTLNISDSDAASIGSYSNLEIRILGNADNADSTVFEVSQIYLQTPYGTATGATYTDSGTGLLVFTPSGTEYVGGIDSATMPLLFTPSGVDTEQAVDVGTISLLFTVSGTDSLSGSSSDAATVPMLFSVSAVETYPMVDAATASLVFTPSGTEYIASLDSTTVPLLFTPSSADVALTVDSGSLILALTPSGTEFAGLQGVLNTMYVGPQGVIDPFVRCIVRTTGQRVYIFCPDDQDSGTQYVRAYKGDQTPIPTTFTEQNSAGRPDNSQSTSPCDCMLDDNGIVHMLYQLDTGGLMYAQFNTGTDTWDLKDESVATGLNSTAGPFDRCFGAFCLLLDHNNLPHCVYGAGGTVSYRDRTAGTWSSATTVGTSQGAPKDFQGVVDSVGDFHVSWLTNPFSGTPAIKYCKRQSGTWQSVETVEGTGVLASTSNDQGPSISLDHLERPLILFLNTSAVMKVYRRDSAGTYTSLNASLADSHAPSIYSRGRQIYLLSGHAIGGAFDTKSAMQYSTDAGATWSAEVQLWFGSEDTDGTACARYDPHRDQNPNIIDALFWDEDYGGTGAPFVGRILYIALSPRAEEGIVSLVFTPSGVEGTAAGFTDAVTVPVALTASGTEYVEGLDAATATLAFTPSGSDSVQTVDTGVGNLVFTPSGVEQVVSLDSDTANVVFTPVGVDIYHSKDTGTANVVFIPSGTEGVTTGFVDSATAQVTFTPTGADSISVVDANIANVLFTPSGTDGLTTRDSGTLSFTFTPSGIDAAQVVYADSATGQVVLTPFGSDTFGGEGVDSGTVYLRFNVTAVAFFVPLDTLLSGTLSRHFDGVMGTAYSGEASKHWAGVAINKFSGIMDTTRRFSGAYTKKWNFKVMYERFTGIYKGRGEL